MFYPVMLYVLYQFTKIVYWQLVHHSFFPIVPIEQRFFKKISKLAVLPIAIVTAIIFFDR